MKDFRNALIAEAHSHGATDFEIEHGAKHPRLAFTFRGMRMFCPFARTPSDMHGDEDHAVHQLRAIMGVERHIRPRRPCDKRRRHRRQKLLAEFVGQPPMLTVPPDPFEPLGEIRGRVALDCRCRCGGLEGVLARIERHGILACERVRRYADEIAAGASA